MRKSSWVLVGLVAVVLVAGYLYLTGHVTHQQIARQTAALRQASAQIFEPHKDARPGCGAGCAKRALVTRPVLEARHPEPAYPASALRRHEEGRVLLSLHVGKDGQVTEAKLLRSSGSQRLDRSALETALHEWRYRPGTVNGAPAAMWHRVKITFTCTADGQDNCNTSQLSDSAWDTAR